MTYVSIRHHIHVNPGIDGKFTCTLVVFGKSVVDHLIDRSPVTDNKTVKSPFTAKNIIHKKTVSC